MNISNCPSASCSGQILRMSLSSLPFHVTAQSMSGSCAFHHWTRVPDLVSSHYLHYCWPCPSHSGAPTGLSNSPLLLLSPSSCMGSPKGSQKDVLQMPSFADSGHTSHPLFQLTRSYLLWPLSISHISPPTTSASSLGPPLLRITPE